MCYPLNNINFFPLDRDAFLNNWGQVWIVYFLPILYSGIFLWGFGLQPSLLQQKDRKQLVYRLGTLSSESFGGWMVVWCS